MNPGTLVRLTSDPGRQGRTTGNSRTKGDSRLFLQVTFDDGAQYISEKQLEIVPEVEDALDQFRRGKFSRVRDLRGAIPTSG